MGWNGKQGRSRSDCSFVWFYHGGICPKDADKMANSVDPDQTAPAICRLIRLFAVLQFHLQLFDTLLYGKTTLFKV